MKKFFIVSLLVLTTLFLSFVVWLNNFPMFTVEETPLASHRVPGKDFTIEIKRIATGATSADVIQVQKVYANGKKEVLKNIDCYIDVSTELVADSVLKIIVDSFQYDSRPPDTIKVAIE